MNKLYKFILGAFIIGIGIINTTNAELINDRIDYVLELTGVEIGYTAITLQTLNNTTYGTYCYQISNINKNGHNINFPIAINSSNNQNTRGTNAPIYVRPDQENDIFCYYYNQKYINSFIGGSMSSSNTWTWTYDLKVFKLDTLLNEDITCEEQYTSLQCQTEYNLIPINDVNANYCKLNFDLIEPTDCPGIGEGTGETNRTARYINNQQYPGTASLKLNIADFLERQTTYNENETIVDVIGYDADEDYINDIIEKEQITPTKDDFAYLISNLGDYIPLFAVAGLMIRAWRIIKKVF